MTRRSKSTAPTLDRLAELTAAVQKAHARVVPPGSSRSATTDRRRARHEMG
jgi:hypothetical protein